MTNRMIEAAKGVLLKYLPDVFILSDHRKGPASGLSPGFGITLTAETTNGLHILLCGKTFNHPYFAFRYISVS